MSTQPPTRVALDRLVVVRVTGKDAEDYLHAQLTSNVLEQARDHGRFSAWLDARGRVRAVFIVVPSDSGVLLIANADTVQDILAKMKLFVLRADVALEVDTTLDVWALLGNLNSGRDSIGAPASSTDLPFKHERGVTVIHLGKGLNYALGSETDLSAEFGDLPAGSPDDVALAEIELGLPDVAAELIEKFVPQMLNLDELGALAFDKGCYPGQEVVARTENLGSVKRRMKRFRVSEPIDSERKLPGASVFDESDRKVGELVRAAERAGRCELLAVVQLEALTGPLKLGTDGPALEPVDAR